MPYMIAQTRLVSSHPEVYEPCEDSFALVDALLADRSKLLEHQPALCLEIGCGSGYVITSLALILGHVGSGAYYMATDINPYAIQVTSETLEAHGVYAELIRTDIASGLEGRLDGLVDVIVCNPPYVPTPEDEVGRDGIASSWAGGENGRRVIDKILPIADDLLSEKGWLYMVLLTENNPSEVCLQMREKGFASRIVVQRSTEEETLHIVKFWRDPDLQLETNESRSKNRNVNTKAESPKYKVDRNAYYFKKEEQRYSCEQVGTSGAKKHRMIGTRYFIIKSLNHENIQLSVEKGIWATQLMNEPILEEAFHSSGKVILIFSVNMSGSFQGYAQMMSSVGWRRDKVWSAGNGGNNQWGRSFKVKWLQLHDLPFQKTLHLKNPLNHDKPVKISRDCQELPQDIGEALCELLDREIDTNDKQIRVNPSFERPHVEPSWSVRDEEFNFPPMPRTVGGASMLYPSLFYQHQVEPSRTHSAHQRSAQTYFLDNSPVTSGSPRMAGSELSNVKGGEMNVDSDHGCYSQLDIWRFSAEGSSVGNALTDDDILEMTYEEYLEAHYKKNMPYHTAARPSRKSQESSSTREKSDDSYSRKGRMHKRSRKQSQE